MLNPSSPPLYSFEHPSDCANEAVGIWKGQGLAEADTSRVGALAVVGIPLPAQSRLKAHMGLLLIQAAHSRPDPGVAP